MISTLNFHLVKACNFKCKYCYATFNDISSIGLSKSKQFELLKILYESRKFNKINFAGGEPTLVPHIKVLIKYAKELGFETSIVTNASRIDSNWVKDIAPYLDILTVSIDSIDGLKNIDIGRNQKGITINNKALLNLAESCKLYNMNLKINTVVSKFNKNQDISLFINQLMPFRWKILQATKVQGQNDKDFDNLKITKKDFLEYNRRNILNLLPQIKVVTESENLIQGSYLMIDFLGRFFDSNKKKHSYSEEILKIGVEKALLQVSTDYTKFKKREGNYSTIK